jgi:hypothetical protein
MRNLFKVDLLEATNYGLDIFKNYLKKPIKIGKQEKTENFCYKIVWKDYEQSYIMKFYGKTDNGILCRGYLDPIDFVRKKFNISIDAAIEKVDTEMGFNLFNHNVPEIDWGILRLDEI